jgi:hypothetical protein
LSGVAEAILGRSPEEVPLKGAALAFYIRKSLSVGPLRFNLSQNGVGVSAGITGLRVGKNARGNYIHMGRGGLYYRAALPSTPRTAYQSTPRPMAPQPESEELTEIEARPNARKGGPMAPRASDHCRPLVLVVDPCQDTRDLFAIVIEDAGLTAVTCFLRRGGALPHHRLPTGPHSV